jgi:hypothetical protein
MPTNAVRADSCAETVAGETENLRHVDGGTSGGRDIELSLRTTTIGQTTDTGRMRQMVHSILSHTFSAAQGRVLTTSGEVVPSAVIETAETYDRGKYDIR